MTNYNALIERANAVAYKPGYGMLGDLVGYLEAAIGEGFVYCEVDHFCDEMNDDYDAVLEGAGLDDNEDVSDEVSEVAGRGEIGAAMELIETGYNVARKDSADTDYVALAEALAQAIEKRITWLATL